MITVTKANEGENLFGEWNRLSVTHFGKEVEWVEKKFRFKAVENGEIVGIIDGKYESGIIYIGSLITSEDSRGKGIGTQLIDKAEEFCKEFGAHRTWLVTGKDWSENEFYKKIGFEKVGDLPDLYFHTDFVIYTREISMKYYPKIKEFVDNAYIAVGRKFLLPHFERTEYWLSVLYPEINEVMRIAAYSHDIERAIELISDEKSEPEISFLDSNKLEYHQKRSADIIKKKLSEFDAPVDFVDEVYSLILKHEVGGDDMQNLLKDSDSISFLENNVDFFIKDLLPIRGKEDVRAKFDWMFDRITNEDARKVAEPMYVDAIKKLGE